MEIGEIWDALPTRIQQFKHPQCLLKASESGIRLRNTHMYVNAGPETLRPNSFIQMRENLDVLRCSRDALSCRQLYSGQYGSETTSVDIGTSNLLRGR